MSDTPQKPTLVKILAVLAERTRRIEHDAAQVADAIETILTKLATKKP